MFNSLARSISLFGWMCAVFRIDSVAAQLPDAPPAPPSDEADRPNPPPDHPPLLDLRIDSVFTSHSQTRFAGHYVGDSDARAVNFALGARAPLSEHWIIPLELRSQNLSLGSVAGVPVPERVHTLQVATGLGYRPDDRWMFLLRAGPTLYRLTEVGSGDIGFSGAFMALWNASPTRHYVFGLAVAPDTDLKVLPMLGLDWSLNDHWDLHLMFPDPCVTYRLSERWRVHAGAALQAATFRTSDSLGSLLGLARFNDALGTYREIQLGGGLTFNLSDSLRFELEAGYVVDRRLDYPRIHEHVRFDSSPSGRLGISWGL